MGRRWEFSARPNRAEALQDLLQFLGTVLDVRRRTCYTSSGTTMHPALQKLAPPESHADVVSRQQAERAALAREVEALQARKSEMWTRHCAEQAEAGQRRRSWSPGKQEIFRLCAAWLRADSTVEDLARDLKVHPAHLRGLLVHGLGPDFEALGGAGRD